MLVESGRQTETLDLAVDSDYKGMQEMGEGPPSPPMVGPPKA